jgi:hypothetical protein
VSDTLKVMTEEIVGAEFSFAGTNTSATSKVLYEFSLQCCKYVISLMECRTLNPHGRSFTVIINMVLGLLFIVNYRFPFGTTAQTTWNGFCLVEIQQSVVFTIKAEHQQTAAEHAKASPSLWSHESLVDFLAIHNVEQYVCYQLLDYEPV